MKWIGFLKLLWSYYLLQGPSKLPWHVLFMNFICLKMCSIRACLWSLAEQAYPKAVPPVRIWVSSFSKDCWNNYDIYLSSSCLYLMTAPMRDKSLTLRWRVWRKLSARQTMTWPCPVRHVSTGNTRQIWQTLSKFTYLFLFFKQP